MSEMRLNPVVVGEVIAGYRLRKGVTQEVLSGLADMQHVKKQTEDKKIWHRLPRCLPSFSGFPG